VGKPAVVFVGAADLEREKMTALKDAPAAADAAATMVSVVLDILLQPLAKSSQGWLDCLFEKH
jgi:hypothetical protein